MREVEETEKDVDRVRHLYVPVAKRASVLYFVLAELGHVDPMYQFSLSWFTTLFVHSVRGSEPSDDRHTRIANLNDHFTASIFDSVSRSLFDRHKVMFAFLLAVRILEINGGIDSSELRYKMRCVLLTRPP